MGPRSNMDPFNYYHKDALGAVDLSQERQRSMNKLSAHAKASHAKAVAEAVAYARASNTAGSHKDKMAAAIAFAQQQRIDRQELAQKEAKLKAAERKKFRARKHMVAKAGPTLVAASKFTGGNGGYSERPPPHIVEGFREEFRAKKAAEAAAAAGGAQREIDRAMRELREEVDVEPAPREGRRRVQLQEPQPSMPDAYARGLAAISERVNKPDPARMARQREAMFAAEREERRQKAEQAAEARAPNWWPKELKIAPPRRRPPDARTVAAAEARLFSIKEKLEGGGELTDVEMSDAAAILELREIWAETAQQWAAAEEEKTVRLPPLVPSNRPVRANGHEAAAQMIWL